MSPSALRLENATRTERGAPPRRARAWLAVLLGAASVLPAYAQESSSPKPCASPGLSTREVKAPTVTDRCELGTFDPPITVTYVGWYCKAQEFPSRVREYLKAYVDGMTNSTPENNVSFARRMKDEVEGKDAASFFSKFHVYPLKSDEINPPIGDTVTRQYEECFTAEDLRAYFDALRKFAEAVLRQSGTGR